MARAYCLATWDPALYFDGFESGDPQKQFEAFAFIAIGDSREDLEKLSQALNLEIRPWLRQGQWFLGWDIVRTACVNPIHEIGMKLWEMSMLGIEFKWSRDLIPEMPPESRTGKINTYETLEEALEAAALVSPDTNTNPSMETLYERV